MPEVTVKLPEPEEGYEWQQSALSDSFANVNLKAGDKVAIEWTLRPKPAEWVNVRMRREDAEPVLRWHEDHIGECGPRTRAVMESMREALAEKCGALWCEPAPGTHLPCTKDSTHNSTPCTLPRGHEGPHA